MRTWSLRPHLALSTAAVALAAIIAAGGICGAADAELTKLKEKYKRPTSIPFPKTNGYSDAKYRLGHALFFDPRVSGPGTMSCATCHNPSLGWKDGLPRGVGHDAKQLGRATPTVLNLAWADLLMWDGRKNDLEDQATGPIEADVEMNQKMPVLIGRLSEIPEYRRMFKAAFGREEISKTTIAQAIATFERTLVSNKAPFDRWLFNGKANCAACHSTWRFTDDGFHDIGLKSEDLGRGAQVANQPALQHAFKTPTLRNIDLRAPYMHDGSVATLHEVVVHYDSGFVQRASLSPEMHRLGLSDTEVNDLTAFMHTLTSQDDPILIPVLPTKEASK